MAQGYLYLSDNLEMELKGEGYFKCLRAHSYVQYYSRNSGMLICKMHIIVHDCIQFLIHDCIQPLFPNNLMMWFKSAKQLTLNLSSWTEEVKVVGAHHLIMMIAQGPEKLRTLVATTQGCLITSQSLPNLFKQSKHLRLLDLSLTSGRHNCFGPSRQGNILDEILVKICGLINLRYLSLAGIKVLKILPETLCDMHNLLSLDLTGCSRLRKLPNGMEKLMKLRELTNVIARVDHNDAKEFSFGDFEKLNNLCGHVRVKLVGNALEQEGP
ncbi:Disease resistance protein [Gossypium australe]|uniref:Disease resistance protein n=1 Tax=Gossypium australe TaxID=47621 RepID=A0A5B6VSY3_9ROSI|nr:Disease resistance protein [Gossypium australe]